MVHPETEVNRESQRCSKLDKKKIVAKALRMDELIQRTDWDQKQDPEEATLTFKAWVT